ncbi:MAG TPA: hypothetical protein PKD27_02640 [Tepidiformaceae bacterium]|nr:hypothetical protein [Tepidiformaceae bacterium]
MKERKSTEDAFPRRPWPGFVASRTLGPRGLLIGALLSGFVSSYWAISAFRDDGLSALITGSLAVAGTAMGVYYVREWRRARNTVEVDW